MSALAMVFLVCTALAGSEYRDHCEEIRVPVVVDTLPTSCVAKAQEYIATHPERFPDEASIVSWGCVRRDNQKDKGP